ETFKSGLLATASPTASCRLSRMPPSEVGGSGWAERSPGRAEMTGCCCPGALPASASSPRTTVAARADQRFGNLFIPLLLRPLLYAIDGVNVSSRRRSGEPEGTDNP